MLKRRGSSQCMRGAVVDTVSFGQALLLLLTVVLSPDIASANSESAPAPPSSIFILTVDGKRVTSMPCWETETTVRQGGPETPQGSPTPAVSSTSPAPDATSPAPSTPAPGTPDAPLETVTIPADSDVSGQTTSTETGIPQLPPAITTEGGLPGEGSLPSVQGWMGRRLPGAFSRGAVGGPLAAYMGFFYQRGWAMQRARAYPWQWQLWYERLVNWWRWREYWLRRSMEMRQTETRRSVVVGLPNVSPEFLNRIRTAYESLPSSVRNFVERIPGFSIIVARNLSQIWPAQAGQQARGYAPGQNLSTVFAATHPDLHQVGIAQNNVALYNTEWKIRGTVAHEVCHVIDEHLNISDSPAFIAAHRADVRRLQQSNPFLASASFGYFTQQAGGASETAAELCATLLGASVQSPPDEPQQTALFTQSFSSSARILENALRRQGILT